MDMELGTCNFRGCWKGATTEGHIYGHSKNDTKDSFIPVVACDEHAKENDFYPKENENAISIN